jgi:hypothetical protein
MNATGSSMCVSRNGSPELFRFATIELDCFPSWRVLTVFRPLSSFLGLPGHFVNAPTNPFTPAHAIAVTTLPAQGVQVLVAPVAFEVA